jgi:delta24-sterol reductase
MHTYTHTHTHTQVSFLKLTQTEALRKLYETQHVIQDMLVPLADMTEALGVFEEDFKVYPLWICPYRAYDYSETVKGKEVVPHRNFLRKPQGEAVDDLMPFTARKSARKYEMYVDIGAYGIPQDILDKKPFDVIAVKRI